MFTLSADRARWSDDIDGCLLACKKEDEEEVLKSSWMKASRERETREGRVNKTNKRTSISMIVIMKVQVSNLSFLETEKKRDFLKQLN